MTNSSTEDSLPARGATGSATWPRDVLASIVVFFVALPLCMGIALASGAPVASGLITGIVGGIVAGSLAGCPLQVSGPAAGLTVIVYELVQHFGLPMLGLAVLVAGALQIAAGALRLGQWFRAVSPAVIQGMLAGIGVLIFASQFHVMVDDKPRSSGIANLASIPQAVRKAVGWPHLAGEEERAFRTASLKALADLTHHQARIRTLVADMVPYHDEQQSAPELESVFLEDLKPLAEKQRNVAAGLADMASRMEALPVAAGHETHRAQARARLSEAYQATEAAATALASGRAIESCQTQSAAIAALDRVSGRLKNHRVAASLGILTIAVIMLWQKLAPKSLRLVPGPLIAVGLATAIAALATLPVLYVEVPGSLLDEINLPTRSLVESAPWVEIVKAGLLIAIVASAETLLCAAAVDQLQNGPRTQYDRELISQGVGNSICGLLGALPMTGVIVRSSANVQAGARTRLSAVLHGVWLLVFVVALSGVLRLIPTASLAAVLVYTGYKLVNFKAMRKLAEAGRGELLIYFATLATIVVEDLLTGVLVGVALAAGKLLYTFSHLKIKVVQDADDAKVQLKLEGAATFIRLPKLAAALEELPENAELHVDLSGLSYIDHACLELLTGWARRHERAGGRLVIDWDSLHASFRGGAAATEEADHAAA